MIRVKVKIKRTGKEVETVALANSGYGSEEPEILIPTRLAVLYIKNRFPRYRTTKARKGDMEICR